MIGWMVVERAKGYMRIHEAFRVALGEIA